MQILTSFVLAFLLISYIIGRDYLSMKLAICDDEKIIRDYIAQCVREVSADIDIECYADTGGIIANSFDADILFLDIQMPGIDGMKAARLLRMNGKDTVLVFVTALEEYVFKAFDVGAFNYIVKPFEKDKLTEVIRNAVREAQEQRQIKEALADKAEENGRSIIVNASGVKTKIVLSDVAYAEVFERKITLHMSDGDMVEYYGKISELEGIAGQDFFRVHRSYLVNLGYISTYNSRHVDINGKEIPVARGKYQELVKAYLSFQTRREGL